jgi:DNA-binding IclR family transcriptional regulator
MDFAYPDGRPTSTGIILLRSLTAAGRFPEEVASHTGLPLDRVRDGLQKMVRLGLVVEIAGKYTVSFKGLEYTRRT